MYILNFFIMASFDHDVDSLVVGLSKPSIFNDLSVDEVETPQVVETLHLELMVISGFIVLRSIPLLTKNLFK